MLPGLTVRPIEKAIDERGFFAEAVRNDWNELLGNDKIVQANLSLSHPGIIRAWHRHARGQVDYVLVLKGLVKICAFDDREGSPTRGHLDKIISSGEKLQLVRIPGYYWHGTKALGNKSSLTLYFVNRLYEAKNPDEERRAWNDPSILDPETASPFDWNTAPHK